MKQKQYSSLPCLCVLCIPGNNLKQLEKKIFETTIKCMTLTSCESAPRLKWGVTRLRKKQTPMQQSRRRKVHQGNTQARDNPDPKIFVAYIKYIWQTFHTKFSHVKMCSMPSRPKNNSDLNGNAKDSVFLPTWFVGLKNTLDFQAFANIHKNLLNWCCNALAFHLELSQLTHWVSCDSFRLLFFGKQMGMACIPMSFFFGHSDGFGHLHQCLSVSETKQLPGTALVLLMDRAPWPLSSFLWCSGHLGEQVPKPKSSCSSASRRTKWVVLLPLLMATFLSLRRKTNPRINI